MKNILFTVYALCLVFMSCKNETPSTTEKSQAPGFVPGPSATPDILAGKWYASDFVARAGDYGSVIRAQNASHVPYTYALYFNPNVKDSVTCYNGFESWSLPVVFKKDTLELKNAVSGKSVYLVYSSVTDKSLTLFDNTGASAQNDRFLRTSGDVLTGYDAFTAALYHGIFQGLFQLAPGGKPVIFNPNGRIENFPDYDTYSVCTGGNCFVTGSDMDVATLSNSKKPGSEAIYGFAFSLKKDTLSFYTLEKVATNEKAAYKEKGVKYRLLRKSEAAPK